TASVAPVACSMTACLTHSIAVWMHVRPSVTCSLHTALAPYPLYPVSVVIDSFILRHLTCLQVGVKRPVVFLGDSVNWPRYFIYIVLCVCRRVCVCLFVCV